jgi:proline-specific peptidase
MSSFRTADGRTIAYRRRGAGPVLVCHPGGPGFSGAEFGELAGLADRLTLVFLDPRGTGGSDPPADPAYTLEDYVADLEQLRGELGLDRLNALGFSHGGMVAMAYAIAHPAGVERLVLVNTLARIGEAQQAEAERVIAAREGEPWHAEAVAALQAEEDGAYATPEELASLWRAMAPMYFASWDEAARAFVEATSEVGNVESLRLFNAHPPDLTSDLPRINAPTLVLTGEKDFICGPVAAREIAEAIRHARLVVIPDAGHFTYFEQPQRFAQAVGDFVTGTST